MRWTIGGAAVVCALSLAACGSSGATDAGSATTTAAKKATTTEAPTTTAATTTAPQAPTFRHLSQAELEGLLPGVQDLPVGYSQEPPDTDQSDKTYCDYKPTFAPDAEANRTFTKGGGMSTELLAVNLRQFASPDQAKAAFDAMNSALASCPGETYEGSELTYAPMSAPKLGDASVGVKITSDGSALLQFYVLIGPAIIKTGGGGLINTSADESIGLLEPQVSAYQAAAES